MRYISLFSGIEAATVAWEPLGWEPVAFCEIDEFPSAVLEYRFPNVPNLGDITKVDWSDYVGSVDVIVGGSPCQSFSVAGKREGLKGESGLMFEYIRAVREVRPRWFIWENVPGALSSEKGAAFRQLLAEMDDLGYGLAWRVLDAQFFGVAQRRRRVFLVGSLGNQRAAEVLFEPDSLRWDHPSSRDKRKELTRAAADRAQEGGGAGCLTPWDTQAARVYSQDGVWPTLSSNGGKAGLNRQAVLVHDSPCYTMLVRCGCEGGGKGALIQEDVRATLSCANTQTLFQPTRGPHAVCTFHQNQVGDVHLTEEMALTITAGSSVSRQQLVCMASGQANAEITHDFAHAQAARQYKDPPIKCFKQNTRDEVRYINGDGSIAGALAANSGAKQTNYILYAREGRAMTEYVVRRITPRECERLQGFPDDWTKIPYKGKPADQCPDTPRYKALGNSFAVPVVRWIGERIQMVEDGAL